jgi:hypothetical protein
MRSDHDGSWSQIKVETGCGRVNVWEVDTCEVELPDEWVTGGDSQNLHHHKQHMHTQLSAPAGAAAGAEVMRGKGESGEVRHRAGCGGSERGGGLLWL